MEVRSALGDGTSDGTSEIKRDTSTDEIFSNDSISITHIVYDLRLLHAA